MNTALTSDDVVDRDPEDVAVRDDDAAVRDADDAGRLLDEKAPDDDAGRLIDENGAGPTPR